MLKLYLLLNEDLGAVSALECCNLLESNLPNVVFCDLANIFGIDSSKCLLNQTSSVVEFFIGLLEVVWFIYRIRHMQYDYKI